MPIDLVIDIDTIKHVKAQNMKWSKEIADSYEESKQVHGGSDVVGCDRYWDVLVSNVHLNQQFRQTKSL